MKIRAFPSASGSRYWRLEDPFKYLRKLGLDAQVVNGGISEKVIHEGDVFVLQGTVDKEGIALLRAYQQEWGKKIVIDSDDYPDVNPDNPYKIEHELTNAAEVIRISMGIADMITTSSKVLGNKLKEFNDNVVVLPNYMDLERWKKEPLPNTSKTIRIGWVGSLTHKKDIELVVEPLKRIMDEFPQVRLVLMGDLRLKEYFPGYPVECMLGVPFEPYPAKLNGLRLDIGLAPLVKNEFNICKSNIKWQEYAISKTAGIFSPTVYQHKGFEPKYGLVAYDEEGWYRTIRNLIIHPDLRKDIAENSYRLVTQKFNLKTHAHKWAEAYLSLTQTPTRGT